MHSENKQLHKPHLKMADRAAAEESHLWRGHRFVGYVYKGDNVRLYLFLPLKRIFVSNALSNFYHINKLILDSLLEIQLRPIWDKLTSIWSN